MGKVKATFHLLNGSTVNSWYTQERARYLVTHPATGWNAECNADTGTVHVIPRKRHRVHRVRGLRKRGGLRMRLRWAALIAVAVIAADLWLAIGHVIRFGY